MPRCIHVPATQFDRERACLSGEKFIHCGENVIARSIAIALGSYDSGLRNATMRRLAVTAAAVFAASSLLQPNALQAAVIVSSPPPPPVHTTVVPWALMACPASIILSGIVANFWENRQLTFAEAWTCGLLYWIPRPTQQVIKTRG
jgi:hypothetical protein